MDRHDTTLAREIADLGARALADQWDLDRYQEAVCAAFKRAGFSAEWNEDATGRQTLADAKTE